MKLLKSDLGTKNACFSEKWIAKTLKNIPEGNRILDAGAGEQQFRKYCKHLEYVSQDICEYEGLGNGAGIQMKKWFFNQIDIVSDISSIPQPSNSFDAILCTEVFEHLP